MPTSFPGWHFWNVVNSLRPNTINRARIDLGQEKNLVHSAIGINLHLLGSSWTKMASAMLYWIWSFLSHHMLAWKLFILRNILWTLTAPKSPQLSMCKQRISVLWQQHMQTPLQMSQRRFQGNSPRTGRMLQCQTHLGSPWDCKWI
jgi:hypothetical protein